MKYLAVIILTIGSFIVVLGLYGPDCEEEAGPGVNWTGCDKSDADLAGAGLSGANLERVNLSRANFVEADLNHSVLFKANLTI